MHAPNGYCTLPPREVLLDRPVFEPNPELGGRLVYEVSYPQSIGALYDVRNVNKQFIDAGIYRACRFRC